MVRCPLIVSALQEMRKTSGREGVPCMCVMNIRVIRPILSFDSCNFNWVPSAQSKTVVKVVSE